MIGIEHILLIISTIAGVIKAYLEMKKAQALAIKAKEESLRAEEAEEMLGATVRGVESAHIENPDVCSLVLKKIQKETRDLNIADKFHQVVQEVTKGAGNIQEATRQFSKTQIRQILQEDEDK